MVSASVEVPTGAYFGFGSGCYINFSSAQSFSEVYRQNGFWYFDDDGFNIENGNLTISTLADTEIILSIAGSSESTSMTKIKGRTKPSEVLGADWTAYDAGSQELSINVTHSSSRTVSVKYIHGSEGLLQLTVKVTENGLPLPMVKVRIEGGPEETTDLFGNAYFELPYGDYVVSVEYRDQVIKQNVGLNRDMTIGINFQVETGGSDIAIIAVSSLVLFMAMTVVFLLLRKKK